MTPSILHIELLGDFRLRSGTRPVLSVDAPRMKALLAYLVLRRGALQSRPYVAFTFWPDSTERQALTNLRHLLHDLRRALPDSDSYVWADRKTLMWPKDAPFTLDVAAFERALAQAEEATQQAHGSAVREALELAVTLYKGALLPECYDEWIEPERVRLHQKHLQALERLVRVLEERRDYAAALFYAQRLLQQEPIQEAAYGLLMRLHALHGDRAGALRVYAECCDVLRRELDVAPGLATQRLYERLRTAAEPLAEQAAAPPQPQARQLPLVGRHQEWVQLKAAWHAAAKGQARLVVVTGEAGIGKTRLVDELHQWAARQGIAAARARSYAAEGRLAYAPVAEWLRENALRAGRSRMRAVWLAEVSRLLPEIRLEHPALPEVEPMREGWQRLHLFEALARAVLAGGIPVLLVLEDLQWTDPETLAWLRYLLRFAPEAKLLVVGTLRSEEADAEAELSSLLTDLHRDGIATEIPLRPLSADETAIVASQVAGRLLDEDLAERLHRETEGNPLFIVETVRAGLLENEAAVPQGGPVPALQLRTDRLLPPKMQAVINARLAQLSPEARTLAGLAATIGRAFTFTMLAEASGDDEERLVEALDELWQRHVIREQGPGAFDFSHDKLREGAYRVLSPVRRCLLHRRVAHALEVVHAADLDPVSNRLAGHYEQAGRPHQAVRYYHRAGQVARDVHAGEEAIRLFRKALSLLTEEADTPARNEQELALRTALGACLVASKGHGAPEVRQVYERAFRLCKQLGRATDAPILRALGNINLSSGRLHQAHTLGDAILHQAERTHDRLRMVEGHYLLGVSSFWMGKFTRARQHLEQAIQGYDPQQHSTHIALYAQDPKVVCLCRLGGTLWHLGYPDQALRKLEASLALAHVLGHPHSRAYALSFAGLCYFDAGDLRKAHECVEALRSITTAHDLALWDGAADVLHGALLARQGKVEAGTARMRQGIAGWTDAGGSLSVSQYHGYLAHAYLTGGAIDDGLAALAEGLALVERTGERFFEAELIRLKGALLLAKGADADEGELLYQQALDVARRQAARSLELRAAISLGRLWQRRGEGKRAHHMLRNLYASIAEGFDTPDLQAASALLDAWS